MRKRALIHIRVYQPMRSLGWLSNNHLATTIWMTWHDIYIHYITARVEGIWAHFCLGMPWDWTGSLGRSS